MQEFQKFYQQLNAAQKTAVDTTEGPVLVVAGPGTGKTQLLSMRVANILRSTDVTPQNILCLTFTEDAAQNMRQRLASIIGQAAYDVEIHTFHSFGATVIGRHNEYFYQGIGSQPIDELTNFSLFRTLFASLAHDNPLATKFEDDFLYLRGAQKAIDNFKSAGLAPSEVRDIALANDAFILQANGRVADAMAGFTRVDKSTLPRLEQLLDDLRAIIPITEDLPSFVASLGEILTSSLEKALAAAADSGKTTPLTAWKNSYLQLNNQSQWQLKETETNKKLRALAEVYEAYLLTLRQQDLFDFNDMITRVVHALENFADLRLNLQEQYQYILVDEFQDTSLAQLRLIQSLTDNPLFEGRPNILAVGDDDQAIYSFQGAELSNILNFHQLYREVKVISLTENYRSQQAILDSAQFVISQSSERLTHLLSGIDKNIVAKNTQLPVSEINHQRFESADHQRQWIAQDIAERIAAGESPANIAVIAAKHASLQTLAPFLAARTIPVQYDKRENILEVPQIKELIQLVRAIVAIEQGRHGELHALLPQIMSFAFWQVPTSMIWETYLTAQRSADINWLEILQQSEQPQLATIANMLIELGTHAATTPLELLLDQLTGNCPWQTVMQDSTVGTQYLSPFKVFYFGEDAAYSAAQLELLSHLRFLRDRIREFAGANNLYAADFLTYIDLCQQAKVQLVDSSPHRQQEHAVSLYTAHAAKGLEFDHVYIVDANQDAWAAKGHSPGAISMPSNLPIERRSGSEDERRRLLFVAMTRAKYRLIITGFNSLKRGAGPVKFLTASEEAPLPRLLEPEQVPLNTSSAIIQDQLQTTWHDRHTTSGDNADLQQLMQPFLANYKLSITHLQCFTNIVNAGPQEFFLRHILRFPQRPNAQLALGTAVHATLDAAQKHLQKTGQHKDISELIEDFSTSLQKQKVSPDEFAKLQDFGGRILTTYLNDRYASFSPQERFEFDLAAQPIVIDGARLIGKIDRITPLDASTVRVTDFKVSKPQLSWKQSDANKAIRLHFYKQQLTFYRLLLEQSKALGNVTATEASIEFIIPTGNGEVAPPLVFTPSDEDVKRLKALTLAVWQQVQSMALPDTADYPKSLKGIIAFEDDLIKSLG